MTLEQMQQEGRDGLRAEVKKWPQMDALGTSDHLDQHTANTWKAALETILESGLLEELEVPPLTENEIRHAEFNALNRKVSNIREYINDIK